MFDYDSPSNQKGGRKTEDSLVKVDCDAQFDVYSLHDGTEAVFWTPKVIYRRHSLDIGCWTYHHQFKPYRVKLSAWRSLDNLGLPEDDQYYQVLEEDDVDFVNVSADRGTFFLKPSVKRAFYIDGGGVPESEPPEFHYRGLGRQALSPLALDGVSFGRLIL